MTLVRDLASGQQREVSAYEAYAGWRSGAHEVLGDAKMPVTDQHGNVSLLTFQEAYEQEQLRGTQPITPEAYVHERVKEYVEEAPGGQVAAAASGFLREAPLGLGSYLMNEQDRETARYLEEAYPATTMLGRVGGGVATAGVSAAGVTARLGGRILARSAIMGAEGAIQGMAGTAGDYYLHDKELTGEALLTGALVGGVLGAGLEGGVALLGKALRKGGAPGTITEATQEITKAGDDAVIKAADSIPLASSPYQYAWGRTKKMLGFDAGDMPDRSVVQRDMAARSAIASLGPSDAQAKYIQGLTQAKGGREILDEMTDIVFEAIPKRAGKASPSAHDIAKHADDIAAEVNTDAVAVATKVAEQQRAGSILRLGEARSFQQRLSAAMDDAGYSVGKGLNAELGDRLNSRYVKQLQFEDVDDFVTGTNIEGTYRFMEELRHRLVTERVPRELWDMPVDGMLPRLTDVQPSQIVAAKWYAFAKSKLLQQVEDVKTHGPPDVGALATSLENRMMQAEAATLVRDMAKHGAAQNLARMTTVMPVNAGWLYGVAAGTLGGINRGGIRGAAASAAGSIGSLVMSQLARKASRSGAVDRAIGRVYAHAAKGVGAGQPAEAAFQSAVRHNALTTIGMAADARESVVASLRNRAGSAVRKVLTSAAASRPAAMMARGTHKREDADATVKLAELFRDNPELVKHVAEEMTADLALAHPATAEAVEAKFMSAMSFLISKLPARVATSRWSDKAPVLGKNEIDRFERYAKAALNPTVLLEELERGRLTMETVEAVRETTPSLFRLVQDEVDKAYASHGGGKEIRYQDRIRMAMLFGMKDAEPTLDPAFSEFVQASYAIEIEQPKRGSTAASQKFMMTYAKEMQTPFADTPGRK